MLSTRALVFLSVHPYIEVFEMIVGKLNHDAVTVVTMAGGGGGGVQTSTPPPQLLKARPRRQKLKCQSREKLAEREKLSL